MNVHDNKQDSVVIIIYPDLFPFICVKTSTKLHNIVHINVEVDM